MKPVIFLMMCCCLTWLTGCGTKYPADFPTVYPMTVKVTDGDTPLSDVRLMFYQASSGAGSGYAVSGVTNTNGVAKVSTSQGAYAKSGIPVGEYVVTLEDIVTIDLGVPAEEIMKMSYREQMQVAREENKLRAEYQRKVPAVLCKPGKIEDSSPLRFTATEGKNEWTIDVGEYKN